MIAALAMQFGMNLLQGLQQRQQQKANKRIDEANVDATNTVRAGNAQLASAVGNLQRWQQSVNNQRTIKSYADNAEALRTNLDRAIKGLNSQSLEQRLSSAQEAGAAVAAMGAAGMAGSTRDQVNSSMRMAAQRKQDSITEQKDATKSDATAQIAALTNNLGYALDDNVIIDAVDVRKEKSFAKVDSVWRVALNAAMQTAGSSAGQSALSNMGSGAGTSSGAATKAAPASQFNYNTHGQNLFQI